MYMCTIYTGKKCKLIITNKQEKKKGKLIIVLYECERIKIPEKYMILVP